MLLVFLFFSGPCRRGRLIVWKELLLFTSRTKIENVKEDIPLSMRNLQPPGLGLPHVDNKPSTPQRSDCRRAHLSWTAAMTSPALVSELLELIGVNFSAEWSHNWRRAGVPLCKTSQTGSHSSRFPVMWPVFMIGSQTPLPYSRRQRTWVGQQLHGETW